MQNLLNFSNPHYQVVAQCKDKAWKAFHLHFRFSSFLFFLLFFSLSMSNVKVCLFPLEMCKISSGQLSEPIAVTVCLWNSVIHYLETNVTDSLVQSLCPQTFCWHLEKLHLLQRWSAEEALHAEYLSHTAEQLVIEIGNLDFPHLPQIHVSHAIMPILSPLRCHSLICLSPLSYSSGN